MKRTRDEFESGDLSNKKQKETSIMDQIANTPGLQHIIEIIFFNLDFKDLMACQLVNKSLKQILENPMFWLKKWRFNRGLSKKNQNNWIKALQMTKNTSFEKNVDMYIKKVIKIGHFVDVPCYIDNDALMKATTISFQEALKQNNAGVLQILAPLTRNFNVPRPVLRFGTHLEETPIMEACACGHIDVLKALAPLIENPNSPSSGFTPIHMAAFGFEFDVIRFLAPITENPNEAADENGDTPIHHLALNGELDLIKFLAPLTGNPNAPDNYGETPIETAKMRGHNKIVQFLKSYNEI